MSPAGPNVLISSAGRRVGLVRAFQEAVAPSGGRVIASDHRPGLSAACQIADSCVEVPRIDDPEFLNRTMAVSLDHEVGLVIPTLDTELAAFAGARESWLTDGVHVSVSDAGFIADCRDKRRTAALFASLDISPLREVEGEYPRFVKPVSGSLSSDIHVVHVEADIPPRLADRTEYVHQELVDRTRYDEYTVDMLYSHDGRLVSAVPRLRLEVRGGEISKGRTEKGPLLDYLTARMSHLPGARGCLTLQAFSSARSPERPVIGIEINARFGGGYPMSHAAGAQFSHMLVDEVLTGRKQDAYSDDWDSGVTFLRYDEQVQIRD